MHGHRHRPPASTQLFARVRPRLRRTVGHGGCLRLQTFFTVAADSRDSYSPALPMHTQTAHSKRLAAVDFFCGAGGMSYGLYCGGISVLGGVDVDTECQRTYEDNIPGARFFKADITELTETSLAKYFGLRRNDNHLVFCGCSPCQFWSRVPTDRRRSRKTAFLLVHFERFIRHFRPAFVVVENVPGLHKKKKQSLLPQFLEFLESNGYSWDEGVVDASDYGVPQHRHRYLLLATRLRKSIQLPQPCTDSSLTVRRFIGVGLTTLSAGQKDSTDPLHHAASLSPRNLRRLQATPANGGDRSSWRNDPDLQLEAYAGRDGIFRNVYGRMFWDRPAPTITTRFHSLSNGRFGHPEQHRAVSLREGAILQTFPQQFRFHGRNQASIARQIGNAVPPAMALRIAQRLVELAPNG